MQQYMALLRCYTPHTIAMKLTCPPLGVAAQHYRSTGSVMLGPYAAVRMQHQLGQTLTMLPDVQYLIVPSVCTTCCQKQCTTCCICLSCSS